MKLDRRSLLLGTAALAACDGRRPKEGLLGAMEDVNLRAQAWLFDPDRLAPELPEAKVTPDRHWPVYYYGGKVPPLPAGWVLRVGGLVKTPLQLTVQDLQRLPRTDMRVRHHCVEGWSAVAGWHGVRVSELARAAGADPAAGYVEFRTFDGGYFTSWDRASAMHPQTLLAYGRNGAPLSREYGGPVRLYAAVKLGYKLAKWLTHVNFLPSATGGTWEDQGYEWFAGV